MIKLQQGIVGDKALVFYQCETEPEILAENLPKGSTTFWKWGEEKILYPARVMEIAQKAALAGKLPVSEMLNKENIEAFHSRIMNRQKKLSIRILESQIRRLRKSGELSEVANHLESKVEALRTGGIDLSPNGIAVLNAEQQKSMHGITLKEYLDDDELYAELMGVVK